MKTPNQLKGEYCEKYVEAKLLSEGCTFRKNTKGGYDFIASCPDGIKYVEAKSKNGKLTPNEKKFRDSAKSAGLRYEVVRCDISRLMNMDKRNVDTYFHNLSQLS